MRRIVTSRVLADVTYATLSPSGRARVVQLKTRVFKNLRKGGVVFEGKDTVKKPLASSAALAYLLAMFLS